MQSGQGWDWYGEVIAADRRFVGLPRAVIAILVTEVDPTWQARHEARPSDAAAHIRRGHAYAAGQTQRFQSCSQHGRLERHRRPGIPHARRCLPAHADM